MNISTPTVVRRVAWVVAPLLVGVAGLFGPLIVLQLTWLTGTTFGAPLVFESAFLLGVPCAIAATVLVPIGATAFFWGGLLSGVRRDVEPALLALSGRLLAVGLALLAVPVGLVGGCRLLTRAALDQPLGPYRDTLRHSTRYAASYDENAFWALRDGASARDATGALGEPIWRIRCGQADVLVYSSMGDARDLAAAGFHLRAVFIRNGSVVGTLGRYELDTTDALWGLQADPRCAPTRSGPAAS